MAIANDISLPPARVRTRLQPEERREQILVEATRLIAESGFNAVSLNDIAVACGVRKQSLLHYFPSMNALLEAVLRRRDSDGLDGNANPIPDDRHQQREYFTAIFFHNLQEREIVRLYAILLAEALAPEHPAHDYFAERSRSARAVLQGTLAWKPNPLSAAVELYSFWQGLELEWLRDPDFDVVGVWNEFCEGFFA